MLIFWLAAGLLLLLALAFAIVPLLRVRTSESISRREANLAVLRTQREELERDVAFGTLPAAAREEALEELVTRAGEDLAGLEETAGSTAKRPWKSIAVLATLLPACAIALYLTLGNPAAIDLAKFAVAPDMNDKQIEAMVASLGEKVKARPDDKQGWALYARSLNAMGRWNEAAAAYAHLAALAPDDANVLADWADSLAMAQGRNLSGKPYALVRRALEIDPANSKALALAGTGALNEGDFANALKHWQALAALVPPGGSEAQQVAAVIAEVRERAAGAGKPMGGPPPVAAKSPAAAAPVAAAAGTSVAGTVTITPELASKVAITDTLFVFARAENGSRMPLAVLRVSAKELPKTFMLDDSMAMAPTARISSAATVRIEARVSKSGGAAPQPGDLVGTSAAVKPGAKGLQIVIDKVLP